MSALAAAGHGITLSGPTSTVLASIAGALITGFGAATLRHGWDVRADARSWNRGRDQRVRAQLLDAFSNYLAARPDLSAARAIASNPEDAVAILSKVQLAAASLLILLAEAGDRQVIEADVKALDRWVATSFDEPSIADLKEVPTAAAILDLARRLAVEPEASPGDRARRRV